MKAPFPDHIGHVCNPFNDPDMRCTLAVGGYRHICQGCGHVVNDEAKHEHVCEATS